MDQIHARKCWGGFDIGQIQANAALVFEPGLQDGKRPLPKEDDL